MTENTRLHPFAGAGDAPATDKRPLEIEQLGRRRVDNYAWLRDDNWQEVLRDPALLRDDIRTHLEAENNYYEHATAGLQALRARLLAEMRGRIKEDDSEVPAPDGPYAYSTRYREGGEYAIHVRTPRDGGAETILFDGDAEGAGAEFFNVARVAHSPDHSMIAYAVDRTGSEYFDIRVRTIASKEEFGETVASTDGDPIWAADSRSFFYTERDDNQRPKWVKRHYLGTAPETDVLVYEEMDDTLFLGIDESQSGKDIFIVSGKGWTSVARYLPADAPRDMEPTLIAPLIED